MKIVLLEAFHDRRVNKWGFEEMNQRASTIFI